MEKLEKIKKNIINLFDLGLTGEDLMLALEHEIAEICPYNHSNGDLSTSTGISSDIYIKYDGKGTFSEILAIIEASATKRKLAFALLSKSLQEQGIDPYNRQKGKSLDSLLKSLMEQGNSPENCNEEDNTECWKCQFSKKCSRKDEFEK